MNIFVAGCSASNACPDSCLADVPARIELSGCAESFSKVSVSGSCSSADVSASQLAADPYQPDWVRSVGGALSIVSPSPGDCHVTVTCSNGSAYSTDVTFISKMTSVPAGCSCWPYTAPTESMYSIDAPYVDSDAGSDASEVAGDD
jgi:hypothetical protein